MTEPEPKAAALGDRVFHALLEQIHSGAIPPGTEIREARIAAEMGVSRGPVREAVRRLQGLELITRESWQRARVVRLSRAAMIDLFQLREALEGCAARLAAERMQPSSAQALLAQFEPLIDGPDLDFHELVAVSSGNERLVRTLCGDLYHLLKLYRRQSGAVPERKSQAADEHRAIAAAIAAGEGDQAEALMRAHIRLALDQLRALPEGGA